MTVTILIGDWMDRLASFGPDSYQMICTSPPYFGLRDYGVEGQLGLEPTPDEYVAKIVAGMGLARRGLAKDGTLWLNLGDSYCANRKGNNGNGTSTLTNGGAYQAQASRIGTQPKPGQAHADVASAPHRRRLAGLKTKDLIGIPWMVAFALRADGWFLRSDIVWQKPNGMPESVKDRPTRAHEFVFLLSRSSRYFYDYAAVRRPLAASSIARLSQPTLESQPGSSRANGNTRADRPMKAVKFGGNKRMGGSGGGCTERERERERERESSAAVARGRAMNGARPGEGFDAGAALRDVWSIATQPFSEAHFAVMPRTLAERCLLAGSRPGDTVLDPFAGAGTVGVVAEQMGRHSVLIELNPEYAAMTARRIQKEPAPRFELGTARLRIECSTTELSRRGIERSEDPNTVPETSLQQNGATNDAVNPANEPVQQEPQVGIEPTTA